MSNDEIFWRDDEADDDGPSGPYRPGWVTILISILVLIALVATLLLPVITSRLRYRSLPTPTPNILLEARLHF